MSYLCLLLITAINLSCVQCSGDHCKVYLLNKKWKAYEVPSLSNVHHHTKEGPRTNYGPQPLLILQPGFLYRDECSLRAASRDVKKLLFHMFISVRDVTAHTYQ